MQLELQAKTRAAADHAGSDWRSIYQDTTPLCTITSLRPGCTYRVRVRATNQVGTGQFCTPVDVMTSPDVPEVPGEPSAIKLLPVSGTLRASTG